MLRGPIPLPILILCVVSFCVYLCKGKRSRRAARRTAVPHVINDYARVKAIREAMAGYLCEEKEMCVVDSVKAKHTLEFPLGSEVTFVMKDGMPHLVVGDRIICNVYFGHNSEAGKIIENGLPYRAFITDRDASASGFMDFFTVSVFYTPAP